MNIPSSDTLRESAQAAVPPDGQVRAFRPLGHRLFGYVLIFGTVLALLTTAVQMLVDYKNDVGVIEDRMLQIERSYRPIFSSSLWTFDEAQIKIGLQGIAAMPDVTGASIETNAGQHYTSGAPWGPKNIVRTFPLLYEAQKGSPVRLGTLSVYATLDGVYARLRASLLENLATNAVKIFLTAVFILLLFQRLVTRHLGAMAEYTRQLGLTTLNRPLVLHRNAATADEIEQVVAAMNNMRQSLQQEQEALRWRTALFEAQLNSELDGIMVVDPDGRKLIQNQRLNELWKIPPEIALDPRDPRQLEYCAKLTKNPKQFTDKVSHLYANTNEICRDEIELADGTVLDRYTSPVRDTHGRYYGRVWTFRDVTARKQLEEQYRQAQKMEAFGQMAGGVAHDFNNILTAVLVQLNLMQMEPDLRASTRSALLELNGYVQRGANLTRQLLMFSRRQTMQIETLDLNSVMEGLVKMLRRILGENYELVFANSARPIWIEADAGMIEQVAMNLCVNSRDAMPGGGRIVLHISEATVDASQVKSAAGAGQYAVLSVSDTGSGMDEATQKRIFEPFFTTKPAGKGTGLGLATVYGIVNQHRGWIDVQSEPGRGSTFTVHIPISPKAATARSNSPFADIPGGTETILLVEDDDAIRPVTAQLLSRYGYRVIEAANGVEALAKWQSNRNRIALLLSDMVMPEGITGLQLASRILHERPELRVIIASGYNSEIADEGDPLVKQITFLAKPFEPRQLLELVREKLDSGGEGRGTRDEGPRTRDLG